MVETSPHQWSIITGSNTSGLKMSLDWLMVLKTKSQGTAFDGELLIDSVSW